MSERDAMPHAWAMNDRPGCWCGETHEEMRPDPWPHPPGFWVAVTPENIEAVADDLTIAVWLETEEP